MNGNKSAGKQIVLGCVLGLIAIVGWLVVCFLLYHYSMMNLDLAADDVAKALEVPKEELVYVGGGRNYCKVVAFEYIGDKTRLMKNVSDYTWGLDQEYLTRQLRGLQRYYKVLQDFDSESPDMHVYQKNCVRIYVFHDRIVAIAAY